MENKFLSHEEALKFWWDLSPDSFYQALRPLVTNPDERAGRRAYEVARGHVWQHIVGRAQLGVVYDIEWHSALQMLTSKAVHWQIKVRLEVLTDLWYDNMTRKLSWDDVIPKQHDDLRFTNL